MSSTKTLTILLAEDDDGHASLVERNLRRAGLENEIIRAHDGQEALDYLKQHGPESAPGAPPVIMLLDIRMPRVDGVEVLRYVKSRPALANMPVIMLTTTDDPREIQKCYELGCNVYITKPVEYTDFVESIRRLGLFLSVVKLPG